MLQNHPPHPYFTPLYVNNIALVHNGLQNLAGIINCRKSKSKDYSKYAYPFHSLMLAISYDRFTSKPTQLQCYLILAMSISIY